MFYALQDDAGRAFMKERILNVVALGPTAKISGEFAMKFASLFNGPVATTVKYYRLYEVSQESISQFKTVACVVPQVCEFFTSFLNYWGDGLGTSIRQMQHFAQLVESGNFQDFDRRQDFFAFTNEPPKVFDLTKIEGVPFSMFVGKDDTIATP